MARPKVYRDPVHGQIVFTRISRSDGPPKLDDSDRCISWLVQGLADCPEFQRLRLIRQNGLTNLVFHGAEHSRFGHSMGVAYLAREMYDRIARNMGDPVDPERRVTTMVAALLHDVGHGPFSHNIEEALKSCDVKFSHERMSIRLLSEDSGIASILRSVAKDLPERIAPYIDKKKRTADHDHWTYRIVSSQLDADRLDYLHRDGAFAGVRGHGFDLPRLLDMLMHFEGKRIGVHEHALEAVEAYILCLDHMYRAVYFHPAVRSASLLLQSLLKRAFYLYKVEEKKHLFPDRLSGEPHPILDLLDCGDEIPLASYVRLNDSTIWSLMDRWLEADDLILRDLSARLLRRDLLFATDLRSGEMDKRKLYDRAVELAAKELGVSEADVREYYVMIDEPERTSYKRYDWKTPSIDDSIWITTGADCHPVENGESTILTGLSQTRYFPRLTFPKSIRGALLGAA